MPFFHPNIMFLNVHLISWCRVLIQASDQRFGLSFLACKYRKLICLFHSWSTYFFAQLMLQLFVNCPLHLRLRKGRHSLFLGIFLCVLVLKYLFLENSAAFTFGFWMNVVDMQLWFVKLAMAQAMIVIPSLLSCLCLVIQYPFALLFSSQFQFLKYWTDSSGRVSFVNA